MEDGGTSMALAADEEGEELSSKPAAKGGRPRRPTAGPKKK